MRYKRETCERLICVANTTTAKELDSQERVRRWLERLKVGERREKEEVRSRYNNIYFFAINRRVVGSIRSAMTD